MAKKLAATAGGEQAPAGVGHNNEGLTEDTFLVHVNACIRAKAKVDEAKAAQHSVRKLAKASGIELKKMDERIKKMEWSREEVLEDNAVGAQYDTWLKIVPEGTQGDFFNSEEDRIPDFAKDELTWRAKGYHQGIKGLNLDLNGCPGDRVQAMTEGHNEAQGKLITDNIKKAA